MWVLAPLVEGQILPRPISAYPACRVALSQYAKLRASMDRNPRYRTDNTMQVCRLMRLCYIFTDKLELDMFERTTMDYEGPVISPQIQVLVISTVIMRPHSHSHLQAMLDDALNETDVIELKPSFDDTLDS